MKGADMAALDYNPLRDDDFCGEVRAYIESRYPPELRFVSQCVRIDVMRGWWNALCEKDLIAPNWPCEWGGMGLDAGNMVIYLEELERYGVMRAVDQGITQVGPILMKYGTQAQK